MVRSGEHEKLKAGVHGVGLVFAVVCAVYSHAAYRVRPSRHLAANRVIYSALVVMEVRKIWHHLRA